MPPAPLLPVALGLMVGIILDYLIVLTQTHAGVGLTLGIVVLIVGSRFAAPRVVAVCLTSAALGAMLHHNALRRVPANHIVRYTANEPVIATVTGTVVSDPIVGEVRAGPFERWMPGRMRTRFLLQAEEIKGTTAPIPVTGLVQARVHEPAMHVKIGDRIRMIGHIYRPTPPRNPGQFDWSGHLRRKGILVAMSVKHSAAVSRCGNQRAREANRGFVDRLRLQTLRLMRDDVGNEDETATLLDTLVLGQRGAIAEEINQAFVRTGTVHFLSVSGTHMGVLALFVWWVGGACGLSRPGASALVLAIVAAYVLVAEPCVPILRTGIMYGLACIAVGLRRPTSPFNWLAAALVVLLVWRPCDLFAADFQLSFGIVFSLFTLCPFVLRVLQGLRRRLRGVPDELLDRPSHVPWWRDVLERLTTGLLVFLATSVTAWLVGSAITAYHFGRVSPWGWLNSLLIWPIVSLLVILGFVKVLLAAILPITSSVMGPVLAWLSELLIWMVSWLDRIPGVAVECRSPPWWCLAVWFGWLAGLVGLHSIRARRRWSVAITAVATIGVFVWASGVFSDSDDLRIWVLSVGDGQAVGARFPGKTFWVCDAGTRSGFDAGESVAVPALRNLGAGRVSTAVVSHPNLDHFSGLLSIADHFGLDEVILNPHFERLSPPHGPARFLLDELNRRGIPVRHVGRGDRIAEAVPASVEVLWPPKDHSADRSANNCSTVLRIRYGSKSIMICGDIESQPQRRLIAEGGLKSDVLLLPHHGSVEKTTADFIAAVDPSIVIRSGGRKAAGGRRPIESLVGTRQYYDTSRDAAIEVTIRKTGVIVRTPLAGPDGGPRGDESEDD